MITLQAHAYLKISIKSSFSHVRNGISVIGVVQNYWIVRNPKKKIELMSR